MFHRLLIVIIFSLGNALPQVPLSNATISASASASGSPTNLAWDTLNKGLIDSDPEHRCNAVVALGVLTDLTQAVKKVETALQDKATMVRQTAATTLGEMGAKEAIPQLEAALDDNAEVSFSAAKALWDLGSTSGRWVFQQVLEGEQKDGPGAVKGAIRKVSHKMHSPSELALMGLKEATGQFLGPASMGITVAQQVLKDGGAPGRTAAANILGKDSDPYAVTLLEWALNDKSWAVRAAVAKALSVRGNRETIPKLVPLLSDDRQLVRVMAAAAIVKLGQ